MEKPIKSQISMQTVQIFFQNQQISTEQSTKIQMKLKSIAGN